jgi:endonuclease/exonuclease/phosphatase (EEP) superfamily protein YafD
MENLFWLLAYAGTAFVGLCSLAGFFSKRWWLFEICSHFRVQYLVFFLGMALLFAVGRKDLALLGAALLGLINLSLVLPQLVKRPVPPAEGKLYRLFSANLLTENRKFHRALKAIQASDPDFIALVEVDQTWLLALSALEASYPYHLSHPLDDNFGVALYSKHPFQSSEVLFIANPTGPTLRACINLNGSPFHLVVTHPWPPKGAHRTKVRDLQMIQIAELIKKENRPSILCGDLNLTPWSAVFQDVLRLGGLKDSRAGFGLQASWPVDRFYIRIPIDHVLVTPEIQIHSRKLGPDTGSDHFPVIVEFSLAR